MIALFGKLIIGLILGPTLAVIAIIAAIFGILLFLAILGKIIRM